MLFIEILKRLVLIFNPCCNKLEFYQKSIMESTGLKLRCLQDCIPSCGSKGIFYLAFSKLQRSQVFLRSWHLSVSSKPAKALQFFLTLPHSSIDSSCLPLWRLSLLCSSFPSAYSLPDSFNYISSNSLLKEIQTFLSCSSKSFLLLSISQIPKPLQQFGYQYQYRCPTAAFTIIMDFMF